MIVNLMDKIYTWLALLTMVLGIAVAAIFGISFIVGGETGEAIAVLAGKIMTWGIRIATVATFAGIIKIYLSKEHSLTMDVKKIEDMEQNEQINPIEKGAL